MVCAACSDCGDVVKVINEHTKEQVSGTINLVSMGGLIAVAGLDASG